MSVSLAETAGMIGNILHASPSMRVGVQKYSRWSFIEFTSLDPDGCPVWMSLIIPNNSALQVRPVVRRHTERTF